MQKITNFLMFEGNAEEAMNFYVSLFENAEVESVVRNAVDGAGKEGSIVHAKFS